MLAVVKSVSKKTGCPSRRDPAAKAELRAGGLAKGCGNLSNGGGVVTFGGRRERAKPEKKNQQQTRGL